MSRAHLSPQEKACRSRLARLVHEGPLLHGTLTVRKVTRGNPRCHCAQGERHPALYLTCRRDGRTHQLFIPASLEAQARRWVETHRTVRQLLADVSDRAVETLKAARSRGSRPSASCAACS